MYKPQKKHKREEKNYIKKNLYLTIQWEKFAWKGFYVLQ